MLAPTLLAALVSTVTPVPAEDPPPNGRGRDPWVFRSVFEDRSRIVIPAPTPDIWIAFDSNTCAIQSFWKSGIQFRGKGWGSSQANGTAAPDAIVLAEAPSTISLNRDVEPNEGERSTLAPDAWTFDRVSFDAVKVHDKAEVRDKGGHRRRGRGRRVIIPHCSNHIRRMQKTPCPLPNHLDRSVVGVVQEGLRG